MEFCGVFNGNGHTVSNYLPSSVWNLDNSYNDDDLYIGLFHKVYRATFKNLTLKPATVIQRHFGRYSYVSPFIALIQYDESPTTIEGFDEDSFNWG